MGNTELIPNTTQKYEYKIIDYQRPYKDYLAKEETIRSYAAQGWELISTSVIPMGISDDKRTEIKWRCKHCNKTLVRNVSVTPSSCTYCKTEFKSKDDFGMVDTRAIRGKKVWCIEHLYFRREMKDAASV